MRYLLLIYTDESQDPAPDSPEGQQLYQDYVAFGEEMEPRKVLLGGDALQSVETATTVRVRDGDTIITDGPFAETKEQLGGFYMVDAKDLDEAIEIASKIPSARTGSIEVRPIMEFDQG